MYIYIHTYVCLVFNTYIEYHVTTSDLIYTNILLLSPSSPSLFLHGSVVYCIPINPYYHPYWYTYSYPYSYPCKSCHIYIYILQLLSLSLFMSLFISLVIIYQYLFLSLFIYLLVCSYPQVLVPNSPYQPTNELKFIWLVHII